jgi:hypothetical protein
MMITFKTVEDYIEVIAGERDVVTGKLIGGWANEPIVSLARYDVEVVRKMSEQSMANIAMTKRQAQLATKIILNYKRQLGNKNIDVTPVEDPQYRNPLRELDYSCRLYIDDDSLYLKFPYNTKLIEGIRSFSKESQGRGQWVPDAKVWKIALTEYNLNWMATFAEMNNFEIAQEVKDLVAKVTEVEKTDYAIQLTVNEGVLELANAPEPLAEYISTHLGPLTGDNLIRLVDNSAILGYTVDKSIEEALAEEYGYRFVHLAINRELRLDPTSMFSDDNFNSVIDYAIECDRLPVYVYEPDLSNKLLAKIRERFEPEQVVEVKNNKEEVEITAQTMIVHTVKPLKSHRIPLLISSAGMIYGGEKEYMVQDAEKIVYCAAEVYNKRSGTMGVKKLAS